MKRILSAVIGLALLIAFALPAQAKIPWGTINVQTSATPTCTTFSTSPVCILNMTANITTGVVLSGGTVGTAYTLIYMQDGTGSRTAVQPATIVPQAGQTLPAITTAVNSYTVWVLLKTGTTPVYTLQAAYDNVSLADVFTVTQASPGTAVAPGAYLLGPTIVAPGEAAGTACVCTPQTLPATWQTGVVEACLPQTNAIQCATLNGTAGTITPTVVNVSVRILRP